MDSANPKVYVVTNVTSVLGKAIALGLANTGATVLIVAKDQSHGAGVEQEISMASQNPSVELQLGDLSNLSSVRNLAEVINSKYERIDGLILNNSVYRKQHSVTVDGFEEMFAANYLGPFLLTNLLLDRLRASDSARIVNLTAPTSPSWILTICRASGNSIPSKPIMRPGRPTCCSPTSWQGGWKIPKSR